MALLYILFLALILLLTIIYINCHHMCMQNLIWNCHDTMKSRYQIWHTDMMRSISLLTKHHNIMFSADHYWSSYHLALDGWSLFTTCSVSNPHHYQNLGRFPIMSFASFFRGHIFDDNINVWTANFAANGTSQEIPCYQLSILTFRFILPLSFLAFHCPKNCSGRWNFLLHPFLSS